MPYDDLLDENQIDNTPVDNSTIIQWWEARRGEYNKIVAFAGVPSMLIIGFIARSQLGIFIGLAIGFSLGFLLFYNIAYIGLWILEIIYYKLLGKLLSLDVKNLLFVLAVIASCLPFVGLVLGAFTIFGLY